MILMMHYPILLGKIHKQMKAATLTRNGNMSMMHSKHYIDKRPMRVMNSRAENPYPDAYLLYQTRGSNHQYLVHYHRHRHPAFLTFGRPMTSSDCGSLKTDYPMH